MPKIPDLPVNFSQRPGLAGFFLREEPEDEAGGLGGAGALVDDAEGLPSGLARGGEDALAQAPEGPGDQALGRAASLSFPVDEDDGAASARLEAREGPP